MSQLPIYPMYFHISLLQFQTIANAFILVWIVKCDEATSLNIKFMFKFKLKGGAMTMTQLTLAMVKTTKNLYW